MSTEAFMHALLLNISAFADLRLFQFSLQEFKNGNSGTEEVGEVDPNLNLQAREGFFKDKNFEIFS